MTLRSWFWPYPFQWNDKKNLRRSQPLNHSLFFFYNLFYYSLYTCTSRGIYRLCSHWETPNNQNWIKTKHCILFIYKVWLMLVISTTIMQRSFTCAKLFITCVWNLHSYSLHVAGSLQTINSYLPEQVYWRYDGKTHRVTAP